uniref:P-type ATPase A domain-containing protein n=1 Tax=Chromera velia CCMP2878 TaxID=1169474 RepID=A0A0G4I0F4_9ALVE|eukprot:Cvel_9915.t1-p1 / transcript=Cvel_9915.t1 / gene=Cvel_9915 / organism=Chromera_velia_CCMP2878 / gene_product=Probable cation-transporting ATPase W08D2.5, putative / transcript_product=Probable cation-transporting ATPase W08D2.5, putative / location=Cvel_scaffold585:62545-70338(-) / protein_length=1646 / sequence_SO=supercontig / SO=protein_coding / is_pseudo=false
MSSPSAALTAPGNVKTPFEASQDESTVPLSKSVDFSRQESKMEPVEREDRSQPGEISPQDGSQSLSRSPSRSRRMTVSRASSSHARNNERRKSSGHRACTSWLFHLILFALTLTGSVALKLPASTHDEPPLTQTLNSVHREADPADHFLQLALRTPETPQVEEEHSRYPTGPEPTQTPLISNFFTYPPLVLVYVFVVLSIGNGIAWHFHRSKRAEQEAALSVRTSRRTLATVLHAEEEDCREGVEEREEGRGEVPEPEGPNELRAVPLRRDSWGSLSWALVTCVSVLLMVLYFFVCLDQYLGCQVKGVDSLCYYGFYAFSGGFDRNANFTFVLWCCCMTWYSAVMLLSPRHFWERWRLSPCGPREAESVFVSAVTEEGKVRRTGLVPLQREEGGLACGSVDFFTSRARDISAMPLERALKLLWLTSQQIQQVVGPNAIDFKRHSFAALMQMEFFQPFYLYQLGVYMWWIWFSYLFVGMAMASMTLVVGLAKMFVKANAEATLERITSHRSSVEVFRSGAWREVDATALVPGDVVRVKGDDSILPCDLLLIRGTCVCDEAALTGEARPIEKVALPAAGRRQQEAKGKGKGASEVPARHRLFAGTTAMQSLGLGGEQGGAQALVMATGLQTGKGDLLSSILFPCAPDKMRWDDELPFIWAALFIYAAACFAFALRATLMARPDTSFVVVISNGIFTISQTLSPMLPVALSAGQVRSFSRLKEKGVICVNPERIAVAGKVRVLCFDKTDTLTKADLEFIGAAAVKVGKEKEKGKEDEQAPGGKEKTEKRGNHSTELHTPTKPHNQNPSQNAFPILDSSQQSLDLLLGIASCHAVADFGGHLVGNHVEVQMASAAGWKIENVDGRTLEKSETPESSVAAAAFCRLSPTQAQRQGQGAKPLLVLRRCEFDHARQTMSVVVHEEGGGRVLVFCKGSFEAVSARCDSTLADSLGVLPTNNQGQRSGQSHASLQNGGSIEQEARAYALDGCYVIALAGKVMSPESLKSPAELEALSRDEIESGLSFMGLLLFRNELKECTRRAVLQLRTGGIRPLIVTGDNAQCGQYIARQSGVLGRDDAQILLGEVFPLEEAQKLPKTTQSEADVNAKDEKTQAVVGRHARRRSSLLLGAYGETGAGQEGVSGSDRDGIEVGQTESMERKFAVMWTDVRGGKGWYSTSEVATLPGLWDGSVQLAVTGGAWESLLDTGGLETGVERQTERRASGSEPEGEVAVPLLFFIRLFARMTPAGKVQVIEEFKRRGKVTGMVGDGGNDCGALRASHAGVAFSEADASIVSPFTANDKSVQSVVELIQEGRGALHTSFACFFFALIFGLLFSLVKVASFALGIIPCPAAYLTIDVAGLLTLTFLMSLVEPSKEDAGPKGAAETHPHTVTQAMHRMSPTDSLLSRPSVLTVCGFFIAHVLTLVVALGAMTLHPNYVPFPARLAAANKWYLLADSWEATVIFVIAFNGIVSTALVLSFGFVFREPVWKSKPVFFYCVGLMAFTAFLLLGPPNPVSRAWHMASEAYNGTPPVKGSVWERWQQEGGSPSPAMDLSFRLLLQLIVLANLAAIAAWKLRVVDRQRQHKHKQGSHSASVIVPSEGSDAAAEAAVLSDDEDEGKIISPVALPHPKNGVVSLSVRVSEKGKQCKGGVPI